MELLSPAGSKESLQEALKNGAQAVYIGLTTLNARRPAANFTYEEALKSLKTAHEYNAKIYVTMNIDIKETEIRQAYEILEFLNKNHFDAVIIKDLALITLIENFFPNLEYHFSTQFGSANTGSMIAAEKLGAKRVILARELSLKEINLCTNVSKNCDVEVFIQGSMCFSFSGRCLLSSYIGGKSANRGCCQAPCRFMFRKNNEENYQSYFSMKDLNLAQYINQLKNINISSLKIEGRLKNPLWVGKITSIYRQILDGKNIDIREIQRQLNLYSGRNMDTGYLYTNKDLTSPGNTPYGIYLGKLTLSNNKLLIPFQEIYSETNIRILEDNQFKKILKTDDFKFLPISNKQMEVSCKIFPLREGMELYQVKIFNSSLTHKSKTYNIDVKMINNNLHVAFISKIKNKEFIYKLKIIKKEKRAISLCSLKHKMQEIQINGMSLNQTSIPDIPITKAQLNNIIKDLKWALSLCKENKKRKNIDNIDSLYSNIETNKINNRKIIPKNINSLAICASQLPFIKKMKINLEEIIIQNIDFMETDFLSLSNLLHKFKKVIISIFPILFEENFCHFKNFIKNLEKQYPCRFYYEINDLSQLFWVQKFSHKIFTGPGIANYNSLSTLKLAKLGVKRITVPLEADLEIISSLSQNSQLPMNFYSYTTIPLFYSRIENESFNEGNTFKDRNNYKMTVKKSYGVNTFISNSLNFMSPSLENLSVNSITIDLANYKESCLEQKITEIINNNIYDHTTFNIDRKLR